MTSWAPVWRLYVEHAVVFRGVFARLRRRGWNVSRDIEDDLIHDFLLEKGPRLVERHDDVRPMAPYLALAFERHVVDEYRSRRRQQEVLESLQSPESDFNPWERHTLVDQVRSLMLSLKGDEQRAISELLTGASMREIATNLGVSRWHARKCVLDALGRLPTNYGPSRGGIR